MCVCIFLSLSGEISTVLTGKVRHRFAVRAATPRTYSFSKCAVLLKGLKNPKGAIWSKNLELRLPFEGWVALKICDQRLLQTRFRNNLGSWKNTSQHFAQFGCFDVSEVVLWPGDWPLPLAGCSTGVEGKSAKKKQSALLERFFQSFMRQVVLLPVYWNKDWNISSTGDKMWKHFAYMFAWAHRLFFAFVFPSFFPPRKRDNHWNHWNLKLASSWKGWN